jgi:hypothetical protein
LPNASAGIPNQSANDDAGGDEHHIGAFLWAIGRADGTDGIFDVLLSAGQGKDITAPYDQPGVTGISVLLRRTRRK